MNGKKASPTIRIADKWLMSNKIPAMNLLCMAKPTLPKINIGPEVEQITLTRVLSCGRIHPAFFKSNKVRLPIG